MKSSLEEAFPISRVLFALLSQNFQGWALPVKGMIGPISVQVQEHMRLFFLLDFNPLKFTIDYFGFLYCLRIYPQ